jgi:peptidoglycan/LPS O-acetylase OafA/YrhL
MNATKESPNLDFLRSAAVLFVLGFHVLLLFEKRHSPYVTRFKIFHSIGHWGVLIFFVHTSLVLMFSLERSQLRFPGKPSYLPFLAKRVFRLFPLSLFIVLLVTVLRLPVGDIIPGGTFESAHLAWTGVFSNLLLLQNLSHTDSVIAPLWSLPYEMQMYLFLPPLFLWARSLRRAWPVLLLWAATVFLGWHAGGLERLGFPDFIIYVPCFLAGIFAYKLTKTFRLNLPDFLWPLAIALITALFLHDPSYRKAWYSCILLGLALPQFQEIRNSVTHKVFQFIARYSYGIYLTHFICIWLAFQAIDGIPNWSRWMILLATLIVFPYACYHLIEEPMIRAGENVASSLRDWSPPAWLTEDINPWKRTVSG